MIRMRSLLFAILLLSSVVPSASARLRHLESRSLAGNGNMLVQCLDATPTGDTFVAVISDSVLELGGESVGPGIVVLRLDPTGEPIWARGFTSTSFAYYPLAIAATPDDGVVLAGGFGGTLSTGGPPLTASGVDVFVLKLTADGTLVWARRFGNASLQFAYGVAIDRNGDIVLAGILTATIDFGGGLIRSNGATDAFIARLTSSGDHVWSHGYGAAGAQEANALAIAPDGRVAIGGRLEGSTDFGGGVLTSRGRDDAFVAVYDAAGAHLWSRQVGGVGSELMIDVVLDPSGGAILCGWMDGPVDFGGGTVTVPAGTHNGFAASYDSLGSHRWSYALDDSSSVLTGVIANGAGDAYLVGNYRGPITVSALPVPRGSTLLLGYGPAGEALCATGFGQPGASFPGGIGIDAAGVVVIMGTFGRTIDFGGGTLATTGEDVYFARLEPWRPPDVTIHDFAATLEDGGVAVRWSITGTEEQAVYRLRRRIGTSQTAQIVTFGAVTEGDFMFVDREPLAGKTNVYDLAVTSQFGDEVESPAIAVAVPRPVTALEQNVPNPFNPATTIAYTLAERGAVVVAIYDVSGAVVARLDDGERPPGRHTLAWDGLDASGQRVASGVYFYRLEGAAQTEARKMLLVR
ncbi:MAG TPA: FlgD immunoglobulin-like domain containing protein [Candidatus Krumholzibacteria bacterium]|nr:FlgD immunoglobulin-like domain containing protein [Candidatus Krumholzibacteria bacterium]